MRNPLPLFRLRGIRKAFEGHTVLHGIDLDVGAGEVVALLGPSGSGKTTLLRCMNLLETPDTGLMELDGASVRLPGASRTQVQALRRKTGMVFQHFNLFRNKTALENVAEGLIVVKRVARSAAMTQARAALERFGLGTMAERYPAQLSGGQQQRVAIARTMVLEPAVMLFDEPTSALDPELVGTVLQAMRDVAATGATMVVATHEIAFAQELADRVVFMESGRIVEEGPPFELLCRPKEARTADFLRRILAPQATHRKEAHMQSED